MCYHRTGHFELLHPGGAETMDMERAGLCESSSRVSSDVAICEAAVGPPGKLS
jgi:hypothetical protein